MKPITVFFRMIRKVWYVLGSEGVSGILSRLRRRRPYFDDFDATRGTDTAGNIPLWKLSIPGKDWESGVGYGPVSVDVFARMMKNLNITPSYYTFVDVGSGKGRALILAAESGFRKIIGVEFSATLCATAKRNLSITRTRATVFCQNATEFDFPDEPCLIFMYNPFFGEILRRVLCRLPRYGFLAYANPKLADDITLPQVYRDRGLAIFELRGQAHFTVTPESTTPPLNVLG